MPFQVWKKMTFAGPVSEVVEQQRGRIRMQACQRLEPLVPNERRATLPGRSPATPLVQPLLFASAFRCCTDPPSPGGRDELAAEAKGVPRSFGKLLIDRRIDRIRRLCTERGEG